MELYLYSPHLAFISWSNFTITACYVVNCLRSLIPKDYGVLKFYDFVHPSSKPPASKLTQWNPDFIFLSGPIKTEENVKSMKWKFIFKTYFL